MTPIYEYLTKETLLVEKEKARAVRRKSRRYAVINEVLYKKSYLGPWLRCVGPLQANYVLREIHEGSCSMHAGTRSVVHRLVPRNAQQKLTPSMSPWPFYKWGIDIAGPFPEGPGNVKFLIVAIDYFTKWIKAKPVATITGTTHSKIGVKSCASASALPPSSTNILHHLEESLIVDLANGLVKRANRSLREGVKAQLDERSKDWIEEILHFLWAHRIMIKSSNGDTPFLLTYRTKAVIPVEIGMPTMRTTEIDMVKNDEALEINLDLLEKKGNKQQSAK
ncbi:reverse transcriptase domain-containing protein [Tanacetum coccineum]